MSMSTDHALPTTPSADLTPEAPEAPVASPLSARLGALATRPHKLLMGALVAGDPHVELSIKAAQAFIAGGVDVIEIIAPSAHPAYHGPVIQRAMARALKAHTRLDDVLELARTLRLTHTRTPLLLSLYAQALLAHGAGEGLDAAAARIAAAGFDGLMVTDLPWEHAAAWRARLAAHGLALIPFIAATTPAARQRQIAATSPPLAVWTGHTGGDLSGDPALRERLLLNLAQKQQLTPALPLVASMQITTGLEARAVADACHGALVGSSLIWLIEGKGPDLSARLEANVADLREHLDRHPTLPPGR